MAINTFGGVGSNMDKFLSTTKKGHKQKILRVLCIIFHFSRKKEKKKGKKKTLALQKRNLEKANDNTQRKSFPAKVCFPARHHGSLAQGTYKNRNERDVVSAQFKRRFSEVSHLIEKQLDDKI